ncbi:XrtA/PEP-CTERM system exopolysaccharide export protein [Thiolapillus sp.]
MDLMRKLVGAFTVLFLAGTGCVTQPVALTQGPPPAGSEVVEQYKVGVDDTLSVSVWRNPELSVSAVVRPDGMITVPVIGDVVAAGKTPEDVSADIKERLSRYIRNPQVAVSVTRLVSNAYLTRVRVTGAVVQPVSSPHRPGMTVLDAVLEAGGVTEFAAPDDARLYRKVDGNINAYPIHLKQILQKGDLSTNYELLPGDIISIPERSF